MFRNSLFKDFVKTIELSLKTKDSPSFSDLPHQAQTTISELLTERKCMDIDKYNPTLLSPLAKKVMKEYWQDPRSLSNREYKEIITKYIVKYCQPLTAEERRYPTLVYEREDMLNGTVEDAINRIIYWADLDVRGKEEEGMNNSCNRSL